MESQPFSTPLLTWDVFLQGYRRRIALAKDLQELEGLAKERDWKKQWDLQDMLIRKERVVLVTDSEQRIQFASSNLHLMNGYKREEVVGKTPRMFQGEGTQDEAKSLIRDAVQQWVPFSVSVVNYRKNGLFYHCKIDGFPVFNKRGVLVNFIAFEEIEPTAY